MTVFFNTGGGDIYAGPSKEAVLTAMRAHSDEVDEGDLRRVPGTAKMRVSDENDMPTSELTTLEEVYDETLGAYCIASENC